MKICVVGYGNEDGTRSWTDVALKICEVFEKKGHMTTFFRWKGRVNHRLLNHIKWRIKEKVYTASSLRDPGVFRWNAALFRKLLKYEEADYFLFMGEHCLSGKISKDAKAFAYIDSTLQPVTRAILGDKPGMDFFFKYYEKNDLKSLDSCNRVFTQNEWSRQYLINNYHIEKKKIINVGFGINVEYFEGDKDYSNHRMLIVLRKGLEKVKGLDILIEAFKIAKETIHDIELDVVGTEYETVEGVNYFYNKPRELTKQLFREDSLYVMPARNESNGITYLEALANKTPIVGMNRFAFPEFSGNGEYGFIVNESSAELLSKTIIDAFSDEERLRKMGENGQKFVRSKYNWDMVVDDMIKHMESC